MSLRQEGEESRERSSTYATLIATGIIISRIFGLVRERAIAHYLGAGSATGAFRAALRIPALLQNLLGEGVLSASLIPVYARLVAAGDEKMAGRVAGAVASFLSLLTVLLVALGIMGSPLLVSFLAPGFEGEVRLLTIRLVQILFPATGFLVLSAWCLGILSSHRRFFLSYVAPVFMNLAMIIVLIALGARLAEFDLATALAWGAVAGAMVQVVIQLPFVFRHSSNLRFALDGMLEPVREVGRNLLPVVAARGVVQAGAFVEQIIVSFLRAPTVAILTFAQIIYVLPISLFGASFAAAELSRMSAVVGAPAEVHRSLRHRLDSAARSVSFFVIPCAIAFVTIGDVVIAGFFGTGEFGYAQTLFSWYVLATMALGLLPMALARLYASTFYALRDTRTPLKLAMIRLTVAGSIGYLLAIPFRPVLAAVMTQGLHLPLLPFDPEVPPSLAVGAIGVAISGVVSGWLELSLLQRALTRRIGRIGSIRGTIGTFVAAGTVAAAAAHFLGRPLASAVGAGVTTKVALDQLSASAVVVLLFAATYLAVARFWGVPEARKFLERLAIVRKTG